jgi:hypothetical protein
VGENRAVPSGLFSAFSLQPRHCRARLSHAALSGLKPDSKMMGIRAGLKARSTFHAFARRGRVDLPPSGACAFPTSYPRLTPWAALWRRFAAEAPDFHISSPIFVTRSKPSGSLRIRSAGRTA